MFGLIRKLLSKEEKPVEVPLDELVTTIAYPDGTKRTAYRSNAEARKNPLPQDVKAMLTEVHARYPQVAEKISLGWGSDLCESYLSSILFDERATDKDSHYTARAGFDPHIMSLLMQLQDEHHRRYGKVDPLDTITQVGSIHERRER